MLRFKTYLIIIHIAGWLLFMAFPLLFFNGGYQSSSAFLLLKSPYYWLFCFTYICLFYVNAYFFIPRFFLKKRYFNYTLVFIILLSSIYFLKPYDSLLRNNDRRFMRSVNQGPWQMHNRLPGEHMPPPDEHMPGNSGMDNHPPGPPPPAHGNQPPNFQPGPPNFNSLGHFIDTTSLFIFLMIMALSTAIKTIQQWQITEQRATRAEADKASAELSFLKAQINPHFLFNTLNNIYTLAVIKDDNAPDSIMKLSNIMRYVTDDVAEDFVPLQSELDCINDYIELQRLRTGEKTSIDLSIKGDIENKKIAPLVLMTFIENVFKYGISKHEESAITILISATSDSIIFFCENSVFNDHKPNQRTGIGLINTKKRLEHLYPGKHLLTIRNEHNLFTVNLTLKTV